MPRPSLSRWYWGEHPDLSHGILGDGITPNVTAVLETEPDDAADTSPSVRSGSVRPERGDVGRSGPVTTMPPAAFGMKPLAPVGRDSAARAIAKRAAGAPPNPYLPPDAASFPSETGPGPARSATEDAQPSEPVTTTPNATLEKPAPVPGLLSDASGQNADSSDAPPQTHNSASTPTRPQADADRASRRAAFAAHKPDAFAPVPFVDDKGQGHLNFHRKPMLRPAGLDPNFFVEQGLKDKQEEEKLRSLGGMEGIQAALLYKTAALARFGRGGVWDAQRLGGTYHPEFIDYSTVAIGLYAAANGITREEILETENLVAITSNVKDSGRMDNVYTHLPVRNVQNTDLGYQLYQSGRVVAKSKP